MAILGLELQERRAVVTPLMGLLIFLIHTIMSGGEDWAAQQLLQAERLARLCRDGCEEPTYHFLLRLLIWLVGHAFRLSYWPVLLFVATYFLVSLNVWFWPERWAFKCHRGDQEWFEKPMATAGRLALTIPFRLACNLLLLGSCFSGVVVTIWSGLGSLGKRGTTWIGGLLDTLDHHWTALLQHPRLVELWQIYINGLERIFRYIYWLPLAILGILLALPFFYTEMQTVSALGTRKYTTETSRTNYEYITETVDYEEWIKRPPVRTRFTRPTPYLPTVTVTETETETETDTETYWDTFTTTESKIKYKPVKIDMTQKTITHYEVITPNGPIITATRRKSSSPVTETVTTTVTEQPAKPSTLTLYTSNTVTTVTAYGHNPTTTITETETSVDTSYITETATSVDTSYITETATSVATSYITETTDSVDVSFITVSAGARTVVRTITLPQQDPASTQSYYTTGLVSDYRGMTDEEIDKARGPAVVRDVEYKLEHVTDGNGYCGICKQKHGYEIIRALKGIVFQNERPAHRFWTRNATG